MTEDWFDRLLRNPLLLPSSQRSDRDAGRVLALLAERRLTERLPPAELARRQAADLLHLARHAAAHSPHFAGRLAVAGLTPAALAEPGGLSRLPPLSRQALVSAGGSLFCRSYPATHGFLSKSSSSGSTGEPVTVQRTGHCHLHWLTFTLREHLWHDRDFSGRLAVSRAVSSEAGTSPDWGLPCALLLRTGPLSFLPATRPVEEICRWLMEFDPDYLLMPPSTLEAVLAQLERTGQPPGRLRGLRTLSETVQPRLREAARRVLGLRIEDTYSSQEIGVMATQCPEEGSYHVAETVLLEVLDAAGQPCGPGEIGRVVVTDLANFATPLIRYETGDCAEAGGPCPCGRGLPVIRRVLGRERNLVLLPDGTRHWPIMGFEQWREIFPVRQFQFIQLDRECIVAKMSASGQPTGEQEAGLTAIIQRKLGHPFAIRYEWHREPLPRGPGGKFEEFICRVE